MSRKDLEPSDVTAICDTREQLPYNLDPLKCQAGTLVTGDYSVLGLEDSIALERKSLADLIGCVGQGRERFDKEVQRLLAYESRAIIVEAQWNDLEMGSWRGQITPSHAMGSVLGWIAKGLPIIFAGRRDMAERAASRFLFIAARRKWRALQGFYDSLKISS